MRDLAFSCFSSLLSAEVFLLSVALSIGSAGSAHAQALPGESAVEQVVVTGTRTEKSIDDSPVSIDVITARELNLVTTGTVAQALDFIPGVTVERSQKDGYNIQMQGFDGARVLVLVDGLPLISPTGSSVDLDQISALDIERIEVIRGAASTLYGSAAMGGVINIISREGRENTFRVGLEQGAYSADDRDGGSGRRQANLHGALYRGSLSTQLSALMINSDGFDYDANTIAQDAAETEKEFVRAQVGYDFPAMSLLWTGQALDERKYKLIGPFPGEGDNYYTSEVVQIQHNLYVDSDSGWQVKGRYSDHEELSGQRTGLRQAHFTKTNIDAQQTFGSNKLEWVLGGHYYLEAMEQNKKDGTVEIDNKERDGFEGFTQVDWSISPAWEFVAGVRAQYDSGYGHNSALKFNGKWQKELASGAKVMWRTSAGDGYRVPNLKERFFEFDHSNLGYIILGNDDLKPESSKSFNSSLSVVIPRKHGGRVGAEINLHQSRAKNFIASTEDIEASNDAGYVVYAYQNIDKTRIQGADVSTEVGWQNQRLQFNYSYLDARDASSWQRLSARPYHQIKAHYWLNVPTWNGEGLFYVLLQKDEAFSQAGSVKNEYVTLNFNVKKHFSNNVYARLGVENLTNEHKQPGLNEGAEFDIRPVSSRYVFFSLHLKI